MKRWSVTALIAAMLAVGTTIPQHATADDEADYEALNLIHLDESIRCRTSACRT